MAFYKCTGGINPTGTAQPGDVKSGVTFSNEENIDLVGTFAAQEKTVTSSRTAGQVVTPDSGKYLSKVTVNQAAAATGVYTPTSRSVNLDMGAYNSFRYVTTTSVPNTNSGTYTFPANDGGGTKDLGETNTYRYVNAQNVYNTGYNIGVANGAASAVAGFTLTLLRSISGYSKQGATYNYSYQCPRRGAIFIYASNSFGGSGNITKNGTVMTSGSAFYIAFDVNAGDVITYTHNYGDLNGGIWYAYV